MANAKKCDRCGDFYESYTPEREDANECKSKIFKSYPVAYQTTCLGLGFETDEGYAVVCGRNVIELCPKCRESFIEWFNSPESK